jgi:hypothetical protein
MMMAAITLSSCANELVVKFDNGAMTVVRDADNLPYQPGDTVGVSRGTGIHWSLSQHIAEEVDCNEFVNRHGDTTSYCISYRIATVVEVR